MPATGAARWDAAAVVRGQAHNASTGARWQGWVSFSYDDAWPASTVVYDARAAPGGAVFAWLLVPSAGQRDCAATASAQVLSAGVANGKVTVRVTLDGVAATVDVPVGAAA